MNDLNNTDPITQAQMFELLQPFYNFIAGITAVSVLLVAFFVVVYPWLNRRIK